MANRAALKLSVPVPPSWKVSAPKPCATPLMTLPGPSVSVLPPPKNKIAVPPKPVMVPALNTVVLPLDTMVAPPAVITPPVLLVMLPLVMEMALLPEMFPELTSVTTLPWMAMPANPVAEIVPKFVMVRFGVWLPETPNPSPVIRPEA